MFLAEFRRVELILFFLFTCVFVNGQLRLSIESLPKNTSEEDTVFVCGNFNNWNVHDTNYILVPQMDGTLVVTIPVDSAKIEYKFSRGSWLRIETNEKNEYLPNRIYHQGDASNQRVSIVSWQDQNVSKAINVSSLISFALFLYGLVLLYLVSRIAKRSTFKYKRFVLFNVLLISVLLLETVYSQFNIVWRSHFSSLGLLLLFAWGPLLCFYLKSINDTIKLCPWQFFYIPAGVFFVLTILQWFNVPVLNIQINKGLSYFELIELLIAWCLILLCHYKVLKTNKILFKPDVFKDESASYIVYIEVVSLLAFFLFSICLVFKLLSVYNYVFYKLEVVLNVFSIIILVELFYYWKYPELIRDKVISAPIADLDEIIQKIEALMVQQKPYINPDLSLADLADMLELKVYVLSKVFNEHYRKNFRDFINEYRVNEFIRLSKQESQKNYTFLALALEVGFNSKSTFNLAFKKVTNQSPRDFLRQNDNCVKHTRV
jgi:AraC-like DNA-binding protein